MSRLKELKYFTLVMLLFAFVAAGTLSSCRETKKQENTKEQAADPESGEHHAKAKDGEEHPTSDSEEHPTEAKDGDEHPAKDSTEHPE
ncbi:hypothetical protein K8352_09845 [Flavobacteriaceae bacterium F89]|uniref:Uncharacterized protein n=1 Tax=Cerina litoralis TaxID=2874477 RepID=A0AAE3EVM2_9FLAO|nr:hypothetical protein [Cerina litoralis]MCG2461049.1 hypothetical protein [Cerina litoralis]